MAVSFTLPGVRTITSKANIIKLAQEENCVFFSGRNEAPIVRPTLRRAVMTSRLLKDAVMMGRHLRHSDAQQSVN